MCLALCVGNMIGSGVYLLPASLAPLGLNALHGWLVTIGGALALAYVFARLAAALPGDGGPYAYARAAFGPAAGFVAAWSYWVMVWAGNGAIAVAVVSALGLIVPGIGEITGLPALLAVALVWIVTAINIRGVATAGRVQVATTLLKLAPLAAVVVIAGMLLARHGAGALPANPPVPVGGGAIAAAAALTFWGFLGLESATIPAEKVTDPRRTIPRATLWGTALTGLIYLLVSSAVTLLMPAHLAAASPAPVADFIGLHWGARAAQAVALFAAVSAFGALNGFVLIQGEMPWAMARGGVFPAWLGVSGRHGTPVRAHLVSSALLSVVTLMNYSRGMTDLFAFIALVSIASGLLAYLLSAVAAVKLLGRDRRVAAIGMLAAAFTLWLMWGVGAKPALYGVALVAAGLPIYLATGRGAAPRTP